MEKRLSLLNSYSNGSISLASFVVEYMTLWETWDQKVDGRFSYEDHVAFDQLYTWCAIYTKLHLQADKEKVEKELASCVQEIYSKHI